MLEGPVVTKPLQHAKKQACWGPFLLFQAEVPGRGLDTARVQTCSEIKAKTQTLSVNSVPTDTLNGRSEDSRHKIPLLDFVELHLPLCLTSRTFHRLFTTDFYHFH